MANKRSNGEGTIFQRADGRWVGRISLGYDPIAHKRLKRTVYGRTRQEVRAKVTELLSKADKGITINTRSQSLATFLNDYLSNIAKNGVRPSTYRSYEQIVRNHLIPGLGTYSLDKLTPQVIQRFLNAKSETGISTEHLRRVLRLALNHAVKWELIVRNPATLVSPPKKPKKEITFLEVDQAKQFLEAVSNSHHETLFKVAISVGLRLGEALGLQWADIDFDKRTLTVRKQLQRIDGVLQLVDPKTMRARRTIPLPEFAIETLRQHRAKQLEMSLFQADVWQKSDYIFTSSIGTPADPRNIRRTLYNILAEHNLPKLRFHDLRHTCASLLLAQGTDARTIMETLGHSQIAITLNTYSHVMPQLQRDSADRMDALLGNPKSEVG